MKVLLMARAPLHRSMLRWNTVAGTASAWDGPNAYSYSHTSSRRHLLPMVYRLVVSRPPRTP